MKHCLKTSLNLYPKFKEHKIGDSIFVEFVVENISKYDVHLDVSFTPLESFMSNLFVIKFNKKVIPYSGALHKRIALENPYTLLIKAKKKACISLDLTHAYTFLNPGEYTLVFSNQIHYALNSEGTEFRTLKKRHKLQFNLAESKLEPRWAIGDIYKKIYECQKTEEGLEKEILREKIKNQTERFRPYGYNFDGDY